jgi:hypothetical protein
MKNFLIVLTLVTVFAFAANAQSKDCCSKSKGETTKLEKCTKSDHTMKAGDKVETTTTTTALTDGKKSVEKEVVVTKMDMKEKCDDKSSCCDDMKMKKKVEKEVEKK